MKYRIGHVKSELDTRDAAVLTQRLAPLARSYRNLFMLRKSCTLPDRTDSALKSECQNIAEEIVTQVLAFIGEDPYEIPHEQQTPT